MQLVILMYATKIFDHLEHIKYIAKIHIIWMCAMCIICKNKLKAEYAIIHNIHTTTLIEHSHSSDRKHRQWGHKPKNYGKLKEFSDNSRSSGFSEPVSESKPMNIVRYTQIEYTKTTQNWSKFIA